MHKNIFSRYEFLKRLPCFDRQRIVLLKDSIAVCDF
jgi:hypothetical protein